ncbi:MAG: spondin domain-containing protein [Nitrospirae bacterium]|nr:spondin domain-containing protein [Nitrospirota bacterium]
MMKTPWLSSLAVGLMLTSGAFTTVPAFADDDEVRRYAVTITNLTRGQVLTPPVVVAHNPEFVLFTPGTPASSELATLAEDGVTGPLLGLLNTLPSVYDAAASAGPVLPGHSVTVEIATSGKFNTISAVGMLASTNDGFFAVKGIGAPKKGAVSVEAEAYDAGSEVNTESCAFIPGPPCGHAGVRDTAGAEGYVHIHAGIHGIGDLTPAMHDWRNPVAQVTIQRIQ